MMVAMSIPPSTGVLAAAPAGVDWAILAAVVFLTLVAVLLAVAETALTRVSKAKAQALAETRGKRGEILLSLVEHQEWLNPTLFVTLASRSEEHTSELQSLMRISYAVFCLKKK